MAEGVGFEPTVRLHAQWFSRPLIFLYLSFFICTYITFNAGF